MFPVIVSIAKLESDYIEEFVRYHLALGFSHIYLYDNEDVPTYEKLLSAYKDSITVIHLPFNNYTKPVQYIALDDFTKKYLPLPHITHVAHVDIDEFIVLKKHRTIIEFIEEYIKGDCQGIGMNWRFFGSSGHGEKSPEPVTQRFTRCDKAGNEHIKTLFKTSSFVSFGNCHYVNVKGGHIKSTSGRIIRGPFNRHIDLSIIQLNHYKTKTLPEFRYIRSRQRADIKGDIHEDVDAIFRALDINETEDFTARDFYAKNCMGPE